METIFSQVLNMSLTACIVILCVMAARFLLKRAPKIFSYALWAAVLFRLLCPVSLPSPVSVLELTKPQVTESAGITSSVSYLPAEYAYQDTPKKEAAEVPTEQPRQEINMEETSISVMSIAACIWAAGAAVMVLGSGIFYLRLRRRTAEAVLWRGDTYIADRIDSPFVMGIFNPKIYLPSDTPVKERRYIIAHERHHIRRFDHIIKLLAYAALCIHWFNPLVWAAFILAGKDMEMSCDEAVVKKYGPQIRADYSAALLRLATGRRVIAAMPLAFGEGDTKGRVMNMARWRQPKVWVSVLCVVLCIVVLVFCALNPENRTEMGITHQFHSIMYQLPEKEGVYRAISENKLDFFEGDVNFGGILVYDAPEFELEEADGSWNAVQWLAALGIPQDETLSSHVIHNEETEVSGYKLYGDLVAAYWSVPEDEPALVYYLFNYEEEVYAVWFDQRTVDMETIQQIMETVAVDTGTNIPGTEIYVQRTRFPDGYGYSWDSDKSGQVSNIRFWGQTDIVGGIEIYPIPEGVYDPGDSSYSWLEEVGIPDYADSSLCCMGGSTGSYNSWVVEFASDVPDGEERTVYRRHNFLISEDTVYDIWFDMLLTDYQTSERIRDAVLIGSLEEQAASAVLKVDLVSEFDFILPTGYSLVFNDDGTCFIVQEMKTMGGLAKYAAPDFDLIMDEDDPLEDWNMREWVEALGIPEAQDPDMAHMIENSLYGDLMASYWLDVADQEKAAASEETHYLFINGEIVYDLWFYDARVPSEVQKEILSTAGFQEETASEPDEYHEEFESADGTVSYRASLTLTETGNSLPTVEVAPHYLTGEDVKQAAYAIFGEDAVFYESEPTFSDGLSLSKSEIQTLIDRYSPYADLEELAKTGFGEVNDENREYIEGIAEMVESFLTEYEGKLAAAPENADRELCRWTFRNFADYNYEPDDLNYTTWWDDAIRARVTVDGVPYVFLARTCDGEYKENSVQVYIEDYDDPGYTLDNAYFNNLLLHTEEPTQSQINYAQDKTMEILRNMGLGDWQIDKCQVQVFEEGDTVGYRIDVYAVPVLDGIPALRRGTTGMADNDEDNYCLTDTCFRFAPDGTLYAMELHAPIEVTGVVTEATACLSAEELLEKAKAYLQGKTAANYSLFLFEDMSSFQLESTVEISEMQVGLNRVRVDDTEDAYRYVPCVSFLGTAQCTGSDGAAFPTREGIQTLVTVNAIDGSVVKSNQY